MVLLHLFYDCLKVKGLHAEGIAPGWRNLLGPCPFQLTVKLKVWYGRLCGRIIGRPFSTKNNSDGYYNYSGILKYNSIF